MSPLDVPWTSPNAFIVFTAVQLLRETLRPLLDERLPHDEEEHIRAVLENDERVLGFHRLRTRRAVSGIIAQIGSRTLSTHVKSILATGRLPIFG